MSAGSHVGVVRGARPAPAEIVAGGGSTDVRSVFDHGAPVVDTTRRAKHPLPWRNTPSGGENHLRDADGQSVYDGPDAAEMFRLYSDAAQAAHALRVDADDRGQRYRHGVRAWLGAVVVRVHRLLHRR